MINPGCLEGTGLGMLTKAMASYESCPCAVLSHGDECVPSHTLQPGARGSGAGSGAGGRVACPCQNPLTPSRARLIPCHAAHAVSTPASTMPGSGQQEQGGRMRMRCK